MLSKIASFFPSRQALKQRLSEAVFLGLLCLFCHCLTVYRMHHTQTSAFLFLSWNLFLAFVPWALSTLLVLIPKLQQSNWILSIFLVVWMVFFPNAPYILTDLIHLYIHPDVPTWFELLYILSYGWAGLLFGFLSLWDMESILQKRLNLFWTTASVMLYMYLASFGISIGRFLRWNSWDFVAKPVKLLSDISELLLHPIEHPDAWGMTILMGTFLNILYLSFRLIRARRET